ncbi:hypothetical protein CJO79_05695 [Ralstonia solanacearum]|nr:hypothetical protein CJO76_05715 [Ralstonia solanacearum]AXV92507.1 hypothetical protein CJO79_05695 [Ralstonia solanacearum]AXW20561.1 hypothetical protein CJO85_05745 [Ralstonia solanacearum]AXW77394.1 hypothetical protein CJO97_05705 [Ralstonia solanacearum]
MPPPLPSAPLAICHTPDELLASRASFGNATYAVEVRNHRDVWYFSNDLQEAVAIGMQWHERERALEQYPHEQDGEVVYGYRVRGRTPDESLQERLWERWLWEAADADINEAATPEIMTRLRVELFKFFAEGPEDRFTLLDFSRPDGEAPFLEDWAAELEG